MDPKSKSSRKRKSFQGSEENEISSKERSKEILYENEMEFEDPFEDEYASEDEDIDNLVYEEEEEDGEGDDMIEEEEEEEIEVKPFIPGTNQLQEGETLDYDSKAYDMIHFARVEWPCLSFDILSDKLGAQRKKYPHTAYIVAGSQALKTDENKIYVMKMSQLHKTRFDEDSSDEEEDDDNFDDNAVITSRFVTHKGCINRIRAMPQRTSIVASFSELKNVHIWDLKDQIRDLDIPLPHKIKNPQPIFTFNGHKDEGFALDWSKVVEGRLASGDCKSSIHVWNMHQGGKWVVSKSLNSHKDSVEDIQWSPTEGDVFASCSVDKSLKIWDARAGSCILTIPNCHESDINVITWNNELDHLLASGGDDGVFKIWDMRKFGESNVQPEWSFNWHRGPITSIEWNPNDKFEIVVSSEDNTITIWDFSLTKDPNETTDIPPQLLFIHQGQTHIKEIHWHKQIPNMVISTASEGFNVWQPNFE